ncbi:hypothetical protein V6C03_06445 [Methyloligella sp. 2.7D]|uniref:hypothetical protein n=1 Tax=unclassified Methyloligella TaxID=2625955 RepID=UPI00157CD4D5|nr:hypothetical protein [Methyloligella sp. GL2]QKP78458.1 hypothetical protein HT051_14005 [Methyloligella sp. GL2]
MRLEYEDKPIEECDSETLVAAREKVIARGMVLLDDLAIGGKILEAIESELGRRGIAAATASISRVQ